MKSTLYPYQRRGVDKIVRLGGRVLLADEMGLGKSIQALCAMYEQKWYPAIVVCPASLKYNWEHEAKLHFGLRADVLETTRPFRHGIAKPKLLIINYDILKYWLKYLRKLKPQLVILDEVQAIKSRDAQRTDAVYRLCTGAPVPGKQLVDIDKSWTAPRVIALSGTPLTNRPAELWPVANLINSKLYPSFTEFAFKFCKPEKAWGKWQFKGAENLDELHETLKSEMMIRRKKKNVLKDLPKKRRHIVLLPIERRKEYDHAVNDFLGWLATIDKKAARNASKAERMAKIGYIKRLAAELKLAAVIDWIDQFLEDSDRKLLVFGIHKKVLVPLHKRYEKTSVLINGDVVGRRRQLLVDHFRQSKGCRLLFGNHEAAGKGLNLVEASDVANIELAWTPGDNNQTEARADRIGQKEDVDCWYLVAKDTIEEPLCRLIQKKQGILSNVLDGTKSVEDLDIYDLLEKELKRGAVYQRKAKQ